MTLSYMVLTFPIPWKCLWHLPNEQQLLQSFLLLLELYHSIFCQARKELECWMGKKGYFTYLRQNFRTSSCWSGSELLWFSLRSCKHLAGSAPTSPVWPALFEAALPVQLLQSCHCCCHVEDPHCSHLGMNLHSTLVCEQYWRYKINRHSSGHFNSPFPISQWQPPRARIQKSKFCNQT